MAFFNNAPDDWQRLDWQILRDGGIYVYSRREYLAQAIRWLADHDYDIYEFACDAWSSQDAVFSDFARVLRFPEWFGNNFDALDESIADLPLTENRGATLVLTRFDVYGAGCGSVPMQRMRRRQRPF